MDELGEFISLHRVTCAMCEKVEDFDGQSFTREAAEQTARHADWLRTKEIGWVCPSCGRHYKRVQPSQP